MAEVSGVIETAFLTPAERRAVDLTAQLWNLMIQDVIGHGVTRDSDLAELIAHVHAIQHMVMSQAAGRAYPDDFRLLGGVINDG